MDRTATAAEFALLAAHIKEVSGIRLEADKKYLVEGRLGPLLDRFQCANFSVLLRRSREEPAGPLRAALIDAISTHETSFFRDGRPFQLLRRRLLPDRLAADPSGPLAVWSAACSTGQEAYSLAMLFREALPPPLRSAVRIVGTDISASSVAAAERGEYSAFEVGRGLDPTQVARYFRATGEGGRFRVDPELKAMTAFRAGNLLDIREAGPFDFVFCRNVAIYFAPEEKARIFRGIRRCLKPGGALVLGSTETLLDVPGAQEAFVRREHEGVGYYVPAGR